MMINRISSIAEPLLAAIGAAVIGINPVLAEDCTSDASCAAAAKKALVNSIVAQKGDGFCNPHQPDGCLMVTRADGSKAPPEFIPFEAEVRMGTAAPFLYLVPRGKEEIRPFRPDYAELGPLGSNPAGGGTVVMIYYIGAHRDPDRTYSLFSAELRVQGEHSFLETAISFGVKGNTILFGHGGPVGYGRSYWLPLWDPSVPDLGNADTGWAALAATFQKDGKLRVDQVAKFTRPVNGQLGVTMASSLIESGWPLVTYPKGRESKEFLRANAIWLGSNDFSNRVLTAPVLPGLAQIHIFNRPLTPKEIRGWITAKMEVRIPPASPNVFNPCNTGSNLRGGDKDSAAVETVCGKKQSPEYDVLPSDSAYTFAITLSPDRHLFVSKLGGDVSTAQGRCSSHAYPAQQQWTVVKRDQLRRLGPSNYILANKATNSVLTAGESTVSAQSLIEPLDPSQIWHAYYQEGATGPGFRLLSSSTGRLLTVKKSGNEYVPTLVDPENIGDSASWSIAPSC